MRLTTSLFALRSIGCFFGTPNAFLNYNTVNFVNYILNLHLLFANCEESLSVTFVFIKCLQTSIFQEFAVLTYRENLAIELKVG